MASKEALIASDNLEKRDNGSVNSSDLPTATVLKQNCYGGLFNFPPSPYPMYVANVLYFIPLAIIRLVAFNAVLYNKICYTKFQDLTLCTNRTFTANHPALQQDVATWGIYDTLTQIPLAIIVNLMLSSYCDKVGHKLPYVLPIVGNALATCYLAVLATPQFIDWPMGSVLVYSVLYSMLGSFSMILMTSFSYLALITPVEKRPVTMAIGEGTVLMGVLIGTLVNGPLADATSLTTLIYVTAVITVLPLIVIFIFLTDITSVSLVQYTWRDMVGVGHLLDAFKCVFRKREGYSRAMLVLSFVAYMSIYAATEGFIDDSFLYYVKEVGFTLTQYSVFNGFLSGLKALGGPCLITLLRKLINPDRFNVAMSVAASMVVGYVIMSINSIPYGMWIGGTLLGVQTVFYAEIRSLQISLCQKDELGKVFAFDGLLQLLVAAAMGILFKSIYSASLLIWPSMFIAVCSGFVLISMVVLTIIARLKAKNDAANPLLTDVVQ